MIDIKWLSEHGPCKSFLKGDSIPCPGSFDASSRAMYILISGKVEVVKKDNTKGAQNATLKPGDVFGGREYFTDIDDSFYIASEESVVYVITQESFNDLSWSKPEILFDILKAAYTPVQIFTSVASQKVSQAAPVSKVKTSTESATTKKSPLKDAGAKAEAAKKLPLKEAPVTQTPQVTQTKVQPQSKPETTPRKPAIQTDKTSPAAYVPLSNDSLFPEGHGSYANITREEYKALVFPKDYTCVRCKTSFKDYRVFRSKLYECELMRYDLRKYFRDFQTEWYDILTCSNCLFSTFHNYVTDGKPIQKAKIEESLSKAQSFATIDFSSERNLDYVFNSHYLALLCSEAYPAAGKQIRAKLWGNLSWLYEDIGESELEALAAANAADSYELVFTETRLTPVQEQITLLSIAGMRYRTGATPDDIKKYVFNAKTMSMGDKTYAKLADDFLYELRLQEEGKTE